MEARDKLNELVKKISKDIDAAVEIADEHGLRFNIMEQTYVGTKNGTRLSIEDFWDGIYYHEMDEDDERYDEDELYSGWQNSSTFC